VRNFSGILIDIGDKNEKKFKNCLKVCAGPIWRLQGVRVGVVTFFRQIDINLHN